MLMTDLSTAPTHECAEGAQECRGALYALPQKGGSKSRPYEGIFTVKSPIFMSFRAKREIQRGALSRTKRGICP